MDEQSLVRLYAELMATSESCARGVLMYVVPEEERAASTIETKPFEERQSFEVKAKTSRGSIQRRSVTESTNDSGERDVIVKGNFGPILDNGCGAWNYRRV